ncbi:MAG: diacylglycerol kinase family lipid kinase [Oscillospiraceae bacterium]|nr:diacylglycerol kinase family lipid kinase [Oscillospiraceae bacterium]
MKHYFVINPAAGRRGSEESIVSAIEALGRRDDVSVYYTKYAGDATDYVKKISSQDGEEKRFYSCGGDGTLNEVVNGAAQFPHAAVGCYPCGSGNDFVKSFGGAERFLDPLALMSGQISLTDLIAVNGRYCVNVCNFGLEAAVAQTMIEIKNKLIFKGKMAYFAGVAKAFAKNEKTGCTIRADGRTVINEPITLCTIANGQFVGGSFHCAPRAVLDDGLLELCVVKPVSRLKFASLVGVYAKGEHLDRPKLEDTFLYWRAAKIEVVSESADTIYALDGEIYRARTFTAEVAPKALRFIVPA